MRTWQVLVAAGLLGLGACSTAGNVALGTAKMAGGVAVTGAKVTAKGVGAGAGAVASAAQPDVSRRTLAHRTSLVTGDDRRDLEISDIYTDGPRTDYRAAAPDGVIYRCFVVELDGIISDAMCVLDGPAPQYVAPY